MAATIGIKIANGEFYPIIEENSPVKKRLVLTTVHNGQESVQIDLYRSISRTMLDAQYIGSLVVENIKPKTKGDPSIELVLSSNAKGDIIADAIDLDTSTDGEHHILNVSLKTLNDGSRKEAYPDFNLEQNEPHTPSGLYDKAEAIEESEKKFPWLIMILSGVLVILVIAILWFFFLGGRDSLASGGLTGRNQTGQTLPPEPPVQAPGIQPAPSGPPALIEAPNPVTPPPVVETPKPVAPPPVAEAPKPVAPPPAAEAPKPAAPPPVIQSPAIPPSPQPQTTQRKRPPAPVSSYKVPANIPKAGVPYKIQWGDTLWDISEAFYRNPWLYPRIARFNNIRNPDKIMAGATIRIPPRN